MFGMQINIDSHAEHNFCMTETVRDAADWLYTSGSQPVGRGPKVGRDRECGGPRWSLKALQKN